jgi:hypothetical protein
MCNHLNLKILIHIFTIIYLIMITILMRCENFVAHLDGLGGTPVAHHRPAVSKVADSWTHCAFFEWCKATKLRVVQLRLRIGYGQLIIGECPGLARNKNWKKKCFTISHNSGIIIITLLKYLSIVVRLLGRFNNIPFPHDLTSRPRFATAESCTFNGREVHS